MILKPDDIRRVPWDSYDYAAFDTETTGLSPKAGDRVFGFSYTTPDRKSGYIDVREHPWAIDWLRYFFSKWRGRRVFHNQSFDHRMLAVDSIDTDLSRGWDTAVLACLVDEHEMSYSLDHLARRYGVSQKKGQ